MQAHQIRQATIETNRFLKKRGITNSDLETHAQADDVILLTAIKDSFHSQMDPKQLGIWADYWNTVYYKKKPLKPKAVTRLEQIILDIEYKKFIKQEQHRDQLKRIRALRDQLKK